MPITPPLPDESGAATALGVSRTKEKLFLPPRSAVPVPGSGSVFGRGFSRRLRDSGAWLLLVFLTIGLGIFLFGLAGTVGPYKDGLRENGDPRFFLAMMGFGTVFFLFSLRILQVALTGASHKRRHDRMPRNEPWTWDHPWRREWMAPDYSGGGSGTVLGRVAFLAFIGLFNIALGAPSWVLKGIVLVLDLFALLVLYDSVHKLTQWLRFRQPVVTWATFPAFLGDQLAGRISFARTVTPTGTLRVTFRCVHEEWEARKSGDREVRVQQPYIVYKDGWELPLAEKAEPLDYVDFELELPRGLRGTDLGADEPTYWQIQVTVPVAGPDLEAVFLAPVYSRNPG